jgi:hypothetical protein
MGITVEYLCPDDGEVDKSKTLSNSEEDVCDSRYSKDSIKYLTTGYKKWVPGKPM